MVEDASPLGEIHSRMDGDAVASFTVADRAALEAHYRDYFGAEYVRAIHEKESSLVHIDVYIYGATTDRPYVTIATGGMGAADVFAGDSEQAAHSVELVSYLPAEWDFASSMSDWLMKGIFETARYPHQYRDPIQKHHTLCTFDEGSNLADSIFPGSTQTHWYFRSLIGEPAEIDHLVLPSGRHINLIWAFPITRAEYYFRAHDDDPLELEVQLAAYAPVEIDPNRECVIQPENRVERRARLRRQKKAKLARPKTPWMDIPCEYPSHQKEVSEDG